MLILCAAALSSAQLKLTLAFESTSPHEVFVAKVIPPSPPVESVKADGNHLEYSLGGFDGEDRVYIWNRTTNNIASKAIKDILGGAWTVKASDYTLVGLIHVRAEHKGLPLQAAKISISSKSKSQEKLLDPSSKGELLFFGYPSGELQVKVAYNTSDQKQASQIIAFPVAISRERPEPALVVSVPDEVATVADTVPVKTPAQSAASSGGGGNAIVYIVALLLVCGVGYVFLVLMKKHPEAVEERLKQLGVQIPDQHQPQDLTPPPVPIAAPIPQEKIMLGDGDPAPISAPIPVATGEPGLTRDTGERFSIQEGETILGREDGLALSLPGESTISRRHASITRNGDNVVVQDLGSTNGTFINGGRLENEATLKPGDDVQFGSVRFRFEG